MIRRSIPGHGPEPTTAAVCVSIAPMNRTPLGTIVALATSFALVLAACGGSSSDAIVEGEAQTTTAENNSETETTEPEAGTVTEPVTTEAGAEPVTTEPLTTEPESTEPESTEPAAVLAVNLFEWVIEAPELIDGGSVTFEVSNTGTFPHEFAIARGDSYETLPQESNGAVDEAALGADWIGRSERVPPGETISISFDLEPGNYVFLCNIASGPNSHASRGQVLSVTVS